MHITDFKKYFLPILFVSAVLFTVLAPPEDNLPSTGRSIQKILNGREEFFYRYVPGLSKTFDSCDTRSEEIADFQRHQISLYFYHADSLACWTNHIVIPNVHPSQIMEGSSFVRLKSGWYVLFKKQFSTSTSIIGLSAVKHFYPIENRFLEIGFDASFNVSKNYELTTEKVEGAFPIYNLKGEKLFHLYNTSIEFDEGVNLLLLLAQLLVLFMIFYYTNKISLHLLEVGKHRLSLFCIACIAVLVRGVMLFAGISGELSSLNLFNPSFYGSSPITPSLGDLLLNVLLLLWIVYFLVRHYPKDEKKSWSMWKVLCGIVLVFSYTGIILWVFKTLVMDSVVSFEVYNVLSLNFYSIVGMASIAILLIVHFILVRYVVRSIQESHFKKHSLVLIFIGCCLFASIAFFSPYTESIIFTAVWITAMLTYLLFQHNSNWSLSVKKVVIHLAIYAVFSTILTENIYERKERNHRQFFSGKLISERDFIAEYLFSDIASRIKSDAFILNSFSNPLVSRKDVADRIGILYLGGYFNKFDLSVYLFDAQGQPVKSSDTIPYSLYTKLYEVSHSDSSSLKYLSDSSLSYSYLSVIPFYHERDFNGAIVIRLAPKIYYGQNVYPELLLGNQVSVTNNLGNYAYAIYQNDKMIGQYGDYPYTYYWNKGYQFGTKDFVFIEEKQWEHSIQRFANGKRVIVSVPREPIFEPVATFSYLYSFYLITSIISFFGWKLLTSNQQIPFFPTYIPVSFRTRINYSMLLMILFSFLIIGLVTISFFKRQYDNFYTDRLLRKEKVIHASLEYFIQKNAEDENLLDGSISSELNFEIARLADINSIDINLFDRAGDLAVSSQPMIYEKGLLSRKMNPDAYLELDNNKTAQIIEHEQIGKLHYLATYTPIRNDYGDAVAYLGIPYFERSKNINDEVSSFLVALMNVYIFLLICAVMLAYFISNSITRPLTIISEKLRILNLNKKNEPIAWNSKDEIGILVSEYNKMISELEASALKLARGERESAWREMAKQIAHEIKNPLTPMKLSIQYLQRAIDEGSPNIEVLAKKVTKTLEEQIENLSSIATAFSSFAKMPKAQNEIIDLNQLLKSVTDLFNREEEITVTFTTDKSDARVFADKNQLLSVFNNLVKNAIQSIPENRTGFVEINVKETERCFLVAVSDNGSGILQENYDKVFVPNFTTKSSGTGLGLAITKQIIDGAGGEIWFESAENVGSTFYVKLKKADT